MLLVAASLVAFGVPAAGGPLSAGGTGLPARADQGALGTLWDGSADTRRLLFYCYPPDCSNMDSPCSKYDFCIRYLADDALRQELNKDGSLTAKQASAMLQKKIGVALGVATAVGFAVGWLLLLFLDMCAEDNRVARGILQVARCRRRSTQGIIAGIVAVLVSVMALLAGLAVVNTKSLVEEFGGGTINKALEQLVVGVLENAATLQNATKTGVLWSIMLDNPADGDLEASSFSGDIDIQGSAMAYFELAPDFQLKMAAKQAQALRVVVTVSTVGAISSAVSALAIATFSGILKIGFNVKTQGKFDGEAFKFGCLFNLPLDTSVLPSGALAKLSTKGIDRDTVVKALYSGLQSWHSDKQVMMQLDTLEVEGGRVSRLYALVWCTGIILVACAMICAAVSCSACVGEQTRERMQHRSKKMRRQATDRVAHALGRSGPPGPDNKYPVAQEVDGGPYKYHAGQVPDGGYQYGGVQALVPPPGGRWPAADPGLQWNGGGGGGPPTDTFGIGGPTAYAGGPSPVAPGPVAYGRADYPAGPTTPRYSGVGTHPPLPPGHGHPLDRE